MKNVVICCDGTANEFAKDKTNVLKLFYTLDQNSAEQVTYYHPGLGTMEPPGTLLDITRRITRLLGKAIGYGLDRDVIDAYIFTMNHYEAGDRLFLFGFSRGAYTVRALAALLFMYGLVPKGNEPLVAYMVRMMMGADQDQNKNKDDINARLKLADEFKSTFDSTRACKPWFVGIWDTVSSVGWIDNQLRIPHTADNPDIKHGRHAIAIDERRAFFRTNLWHPKPSASGQDLKQVWFPGVHCDVGGGYPEEESGLSKIALEWMINEAGAVGLKIDPRRVETVLGKHDGNSHAAPDPNALMHESLTWNWWPAELIPKLHYDWKSGRQRRRMNMGRRRTVPAGSLVHRSAYERGGDYSKSLPATTIKV